MVHAFIYSAPRICVFSDFPAGSVNVDVYCDGIIKATAEIKYYTTPEAMKCLLGAAGPRDDVYQVSWSFHEVCNKPKS